MKVRARTNIKREDGWKYAGNVFEIRDDELMELVGLVEVLGAPVKPSGADTPASAPADEAEKPVAEEPAKTEKKPAARKRKA